MRSPNPYIPTASRLTIEERAEIAAEFQPMTPCPKCNGWTVHVRPAKGLHWARLDCSDCGTLRRFLPRPNNYCKRGLVWK
jgi:hypothetical protein